MNFVKGLFYIHWHDHVTFVPCLLLYCITCIDLCMLHSWNELNMIVLYEFLNVVLWIWFAKFYWEFLPWKLAYNFLVGCVPLPTFSIDGVLSLSILQNSLRNIGANIFFKLWLGLGRWGWCRHGASMRTWVLISRSHLKTKWSSLHLHRSPGRDRQTLGAPWTASVAK